MSKTFLPSAHITLKIDTAQDPVQDKPVSQPQMNRLVRFEPSIRKLTQKQRDFVAELENHRYWSDRDEPDCRLLPHVLGQLKRVRKHVDGYLAACPVCGGKLFIKEVSFNRIRHDCWGGCDFHAVSTRLDLMPPGLRGKQPKR